MIMKTKAILLGTAALMFTLTSEKAIAQIGTPYIHDPSTIMECDGKYYTFGTGGGGLISEDGWTWNGGGVRPGFEGGQMPLYRRIPKRGFNNIFAKEYAIVNVSDLNQFTEDTVVDAELLKAAGLIKKACDGVKVLGDGELTTKLTVKAAKFTKSAVEKIEKAGGKAEVM